MQDLQNQTFEYYKELYEKELKKNEELTEALVTAEQQRDDYKFHLDNIHNSLLWRVMYPFRICFSHVKNFFIRIKRYSSLKQLMKKIQSKIIERKAYKSYGTNSMPSIEEIKRQRETVFSKDITISILVPLYNTPEKFKRKFERTGIVKELRARQQFDKPSVLKRLARERAAYAQKMRLAED